MLLRWAILCFIVAVIAAVLGFTNIAVAAASVARILFFAFLLIFVGLLVAGLMTRA